MAIKFWILGVTVVLGLFMIVYLGTYRGYKRIEPDTTSPVQNEQEVKLNTKDTSLGGIPVRIYIPGGTSDSGAGIIYFHGGGWTRGSVAKSDQNVRALAQRFDKVMVSVEYRLAPSHTFPAAFDDCLKATIAFLEKAEEYGVDPNRVAVEGDSAGGNLAAAVALKLGSRLKAQILIYPPLQAIDFNTPSYQVTGPKSDKLPKSVMVSMWLNYSQGHSEQLEAAVVNNHTSSVIKQSMAKTFLNTDTLGKEYIPKEYVKWRTDFGNEIVWNELKDVFLNQYFAPLMAADLTGAPRAFVLTCEYDVLRDDGVMYVRRLEQAGVKVSHYHVWNGAHMLMHSLMNPDPTVEKILVTLEDFLKDL